MNIKKIILKALLVILWLIFIFHFSNQIGEESTNLTNEIIDKVFFFIHNDFFFIFIRKVAHFTEYFILAILFYNFLLEFNIDKKVVIVLLFCLLCACFDEFHQLFINGREGKLLDVFIDLFGSISFILLKHFAYKR